MSSTVRAHTSTEYPYAWRSLAAMSGPFARVCCKRTRLSMTALGASICVLVALVFFAYFQTGVLRCLLCESASPPSAAPLAEWDSGSFELPPSAPSPSADDSNSGSTKPLLAVPTIPTLALLVLLTNAALGMCFASFCFCFYGDADGSCALQGTQKRLAWCMALSAAFGLFGVCVAGAALWSPTCNELSCTPTAGQQQAERTNVEIIHSQSAYHACSTGIAVEILTTSQL